MTYYAAYKLAVAIIILYTLVIFLSFHYYIGYTYYNNYAVLCTYTHLSFKATYVCV